MNLNNVDRIMAQSNVYISNITHSLILFIPTIEESLQQTK